MFSDNPRMYQEKGYTISRVDIPPRANMPRIMPPPTQTPRGFGPAGEYHSDTADSLLEVPMDKSLTLGGTLGSVNSERKKVKKRIKKKRKDADLDSEDDLNNTTLFALNSSAKFKADGSLEYSDFKTLPLTSTTLKATQSMNNTELRDAKDVKADVPPLDFSTLRGSHESVTFAPYSATFRSTDTVITDRLLPPLKEEKLKSKLQTVTDTEV